VPDVPVPAGEHIVFPELIKNLCLAKLMFDINYTFNFKK
jgi:hypothetical protein